LFALRNNPAVTRYLGRDDDKDSSVVEGMILTRPSELLTHKFAEVLSTSV
jgi:hypothetical protein